jgi:hypothetical protein
MAFSYNGVHAEALKGARYWNVRQGWPPLVLWWVGQDHIPEWSEGVERLELLHDDRPGPRAFNFKEAYAIDGSSMTIDRDRVRALAAENARDQGELLAYVRSLEA